MGGGVEPSHSSGAAAHCVLWKGLFAANSCGVWYFNELCAAHPLAVIPAIATMTQTGDRDMRIALKPALVALVIALSALSAPVAAQEFDAGLDAYQRGDYAQALNEWRPLAEQGDARAQHKLGYMYRFGQGVAQDFGAAVTWWRQAAGQGYAKTQNNLGAMYFFGQGVAQDFGEAAKWWRQAAEQGYAKAQASLGNMYAEGWGVAQDDGAAVKWLRMAAEQGDALAQASLGAMYAVGKGVARDYVRAYMWYSLSARQGNAAAAELRDRAADFMTDEQIGEARELARARRPI